MVRACDFCRRRKIRCDSTKPSCSTCRSSNRACVYYAGPRKQRPSAARIEVLESEKAALEEALARLMGGAADGGAPRDALLESVVVRDGRVALRPRGSGGGGSADWERSVEGRGHFRERVHAEAEGLGARGEHGWDHGSHDDGGAPSVGGDEERAVSHPSGKGVCAVDEPGLAYKSPHASDSIFSSTSVVQTSSATRVSTHEQQRACTETLRYQLIANAAMERQREHRLRGISTIRGVPAALALHLLDLHWSRQHHTFLLTYRPTFMRELEHGGPYCSDLLLYTVFACASKFSERPDPETGQAFFTRCDDLLLREGLLVQSSIPTVIALVMLGSTFIARGMTSKGWLYTGYAMRMLYDLGLHTDPPLEMNRDNIEEIEIRRRVFWGAFVCEKLQSLYLGRPPTIRLQDVHVSQDFLDSFEELEPWVPYDDYPSPGSTMSSTPPPLAYSVSVFQQLCLLSEIMTEIIDKIYCVGAPASSTRREIRALDDLLTSWYTSLPEHLAYEPWAKNPLAPPPAIVAPNRIILLTTYHSLIVLLHRPFITPSSPADHDHLHATTTTTTTTTTIGTPAFAWKRCTTAARHITSLALSYQSIYPLRKSSYLLSYAVYVASTIHVLNTASLAAGSSDDANANAHAHAESSSLLGASLKCLDALAVPNSGAADTVRIIRRLMVAKGVEETAAAEPQSSTRPDPASSALQLSNTSPTYDDVEQMQLFQDIFGPGQDSLFGFMSENISLGTFDLDGALP
ncbi:fungal-specific transcription factor domain-containing protein [Aspergillus pseudoustus]|uniref:Fungal-specific transcription factor domain-containing protein n=1 Tax=Aspergillus pseudoustus TaxID=1810923 RepID=A0ABR4IWZ5_9EURO